MEGSKVPFMSLESKLNKLRSKYLTKMIHNNVVQQKHIRNQEKYKQQMRKKLEQSYVRHEKIKQQDNKKKEKEKEDKKRKEHHKTKRIMENMKIERNTMRESQVQYEQQLVLSPKSLNKSKTQSAEKLQHARSNTLYMKRIDNEKSYSNHIMIQNLEKFERYRNNISRSKYALDTSVEQCHMRRQLAKQVNNSVKQEWRNKLISKMCSKIINFKQHQQLKKKQYLKERKRFQNLTEFNKNRHQQRIRKDLLSSIQRQNKKQNEYLAKQRKAIELKQLSLDRIKSQAQKLILKEDRVRLNKENIDRSRIECGSSVVKQHASITIAGKQIRGKIEKYRQEKIMMDFLSNEHSIKFNQSQIG